MKYNTISSLFEGICDAIRQKKKSTDLIEHQNIPNEILSIEGFDSGLYPIKIDCEALKLRNDISTDSIAVNKPTNVKTIKLMDSMSKKGISSASTATQVYQALKPAIDIIANELNLVASEPQYLDNKGLLIRFYHINSGREALYISMPTNTSYFWRYLTYGIPLADLFGGDMEYGRYSLTLAVEVDYAEFRCIDITNNDMYMEIYNTNSGLSVFDIYSGNVNNNNNKFNYILSKLSFNRTELDTICSTGFISGGGSNHLYLMKPWIEEYGITNGALKTYEVLRKTKFDGQSVISPYGSECITTDNLYILENVDHFKTDDVRLDKRILLFSNNIGVDSGDMLIIGDLKYLVLNGNNFGTFLIDITEEENG